MTVESGIPAPDFRIVHLAAPVRLAIRSLAALAARPGAFIETSALARRLELPAASLSKCFQQLARRGLLSARRGPGGGYRLARPAGRITLAAVAAALQDHGGRPPMCLAQDRPCSPRRPCRLHSAASRADRLVHEALARLTLSDMVVKRTGGTR